MAGGASDASRHRQYIAAAEAVPPKQVSPLRAGWQRLVRIHTRIEESWIGDLIGVLALFLGLWMALVFGWAVQ